MSDYVLCRSEAEPGVRLVDEAPQDRAPSIRILRAGVCGTDIQIARGERPDAARILGHEAVGATDRGLVVFNPVDPNNQDQILGHTYDGVFRSRYPLEAGFCPRFVPVPAGLAPELIALCEPVATALYGWELVPELPAYVGIWGAGPMGLLHAFLAMEGGSSVTLVHPSSSRLDWAMRLFERQLECATPGHVPTQHLDVGLLCTDRGGTEAALAEAVALLRPGGTLVLVGGVPRGFRSVALPGIDLDAVRRSNTCGRQGPNGGITDGTTQNGKRVGVTGHRGTSDQQIRSAYDLISSHQAFFGRLITHKVSPSEAVELINRRCRGEELDAAGAEIVKIVISFSG